MQKVKVAGVWKETSPRVKVAGVWKEITAGYIKVAGIWKLFRMPFCFQGTVKLSSRFTTDSNGGQVERRSYIRYGNGPAAGGTPGGDVYGSLLPRQITVDGVLFELRGIETGSDPLLGIGSAWKWLSIQTYGNININKLARIGYISGYRFVVLSAGYRADIDMTFISCTLENNNQFPVDVELTLTF